MGAENPWVARTDGGREPMGAVRCGNLRVAVRCGNLWVAEMEAENLWGP